MSRRAEQPPMTLQEAQAALKQLSTRIAELSPIATVSPERLIRMAIMAIGRDPYLLRCTPQSLQLAVLHAATLGLEIGGPLAESALVPYKGRVQLLPMVRGFITLARRGGAILNVVPRVVREGDEFDVGYGTRPYIHHKPALGKGGEDDADITAVYALVYVPGLAEPDFDVLSREEVERIRDVGQNANDPSSPWRKWFGEQAKKTAIKRVLKRQPLTEHALAAVELDNRHEVGAMTAPSLLLDTLEDVQQARSEAVIERTQARMGELRERLQPRLGKGTPPAQPVVVQGGAAHEREPVACQGRRSS